MLLLIVILIGILILFARRAKRDVISGFPEAEAIKWRPSAGTVIALVSVALLFVFAYISSKSLFRRPTAKAELCFYHEWSLPRRHGVVKGFRVHLLSEDGEVFDSREWNE